MSPEKAIAKQDTYLIRMMTPRSGRLRKFQGSFVSLRAMFGRLAVVGYPGIHPLVKIVNAASRNVHSGFILPFQQHFSHFIRPRSR